MLWLVMAVLSAIFAGLTAVLAKCGIKKTDSDIATALRTIVVLIFSWIMVFIVGSADTIMQIDDKSLLFLILSGAATGASWVCYFKALSVGDVNKVVSVDKSSTILSVLLAIILFGETNNLPVKLIATALLAVGVFLMIEKKNSDHKGTKRIWLPYAVGSAVFAALTSILAKIGISGVESNLGTAIRTGVVLVVAWGIVFIKGKHHELRDIDRKELLFIVLSGLATGASWLWSSSTICNLLEKREYLGHTINFKTRKHFKDKKSHYVPEDEWTIFENTHEAIIDQQTFDLVQKIRGNVRRYPDGWGEAAPLTGLLYCADCGGKMYVHRTNNGKRISQYTCSQYTKVPCGTLCKTQHRINEDVVLSLVSEMLKAIAEYAKHDRAEFVRVVQEAQSSQQTAEVRKQRTRLATAKQRVSELEVLLCKIYEDNILGKLSDSRYATLDAQYEKEQTELTAEISALRWQGVSAVS